ncbi:RIO1 family-domain-containing protein [Schizophyllum amplum]|uniref:Serine/threonine-protein kinase RIO2 n=1 Tax=Schizophyllum amplum TaxID=97359 RepID=A0A550CMY2_9AGAR|nr:RIO1 family-domain-containing protein [Auriculariopsis ampla]
MKLDATDLRYVTTEEFRVLTAVEMGSKNHEVVPTSLIAQISGLRSGGANKCIGSLAKRNLVSKVQNAKYDGYRLTYGGYDYLAMRALSKRDSMHSVGNQIGVGKESDIYVVADADGNEMVLKLHRLGRISFRAIKTKRDYMGKRKSASWMYMSRLAAQKEWAFMKVLHEHGFPVPKPIDQARHCILMEKIDAYPLRQVSEVPNPGKLYSTLMDLIVRFAQAGLIHGDFNEFNILVRKESGEAIVIDFPQMVSTAHENAEWYFNRDVECIRTFFRRRFRYESALYPRFKTTLAKDGEGPGFQLDVEVAASGFGRREMKVLEEYMNEVKDEEGPEDDEEMGSDEEETSESDDDEDEKEKEDEDCKEDGKVTPNATSAEPRPQQASSSKIPADEEQSDHGRNGRPSELLPQSPQSPVPRNLSRSPPRSRSLSPDAIDKMTARMEQMDVKDIAAAELKRQRERQHRKHHTKQSTRRAGRPKGSKAKQDSRVKMDHGGGWE